MSKSLLSCSGSIWRTRKFRSAQNRQRRKQGSAGLDTHGFLLKVYRNNPSLEKVSLSSSLISSTTNIFFALFMNCMSARLRFLKQKYMTASLHKSRRSPNVLRSSGKAGSKYTQSAARITSGLSFTTSAGNGSPLCFC